MRNANCLLIFILMLVSNFPAAAQTQNGSCVVFANGKKVLTENYQLVSKADGTINLTTDVAASKIETVAGTNRPQSLTI